MNCPSCEAFGRYVNPENNKVNTIEWEQSIKLSFGSTGKLVTEYLGIWGKEMNK